jgi:hypothetical protein
LSGDESIVAAFDALFVILDEKRNRATFESCPASFTHRLELVQDRIRLCDEYCWLGDGFLATE